jgi:branched-chain amino acid transport system ATP-binding protein
MNNALLSIRNLTVSYGNIIALQQISFDVAQGEIVTLIGANGAGKSSVLRAISGIIPFDGTINYKGTSLKSVPADAIVGMGIAQVPEGRGIFGNLTVMENLRLSTWQRRDKDKMARDYEKVFSLFPRLAQRQRQLGGMLSGGEQQMLAVARALMSDAEMLLLDEPSMGLSPVLVREIFRIIVEINQAGKTILLVEQNANMSLHIASRGYVLETGRIVLAGTGRELMGNPRIKEAYLGG